MAERMAFGKPIYMKSVEEKGENLSRGVWNLSETSEGNLFPSDGDVFSSSDSAEKANREIMATMGMKLFYGQLPDGNVVEFIRKGRIAERDMKAIRDMGVKRLWWSTFTAKTWLIDNVEQRTTKEIDLSPKETTAEALRWGPAFGYPHMEVPWPKKSTKRSGTKRRASGHEMPPPRIMGSR
ncbi:MAG: hypothetical protein PHQ43_09015 [Dehalococcoidales bacterium]|nr:hypothetical protein [Dehalococcoidales bacterium]